MTREEKITLLQQIADGKGSIEELMPAVEYHAIRIQGPENTITLNAWNATPPINQKLNESEYHQWLKKFEAINSRRREPHPITELNLISDEGCKILYHCKGLANCLNGCGCEWKEDVMSGNENR